LSPSAFEEERKGAAELRRETTRRRGGKRREKREERRRRTVEGGRDVYPPFLPVRKGTGSHERKKSKTNSQEAVPPLSRESNRGKKNHYVVSAEVISL